MEKRLQGEDIIGSQTEMENNNETGNADFEKD